LNTIEERELEERQQELFDEVIENGPFQIRFPRLSELDQDEEWCEVEVDGHWKRIRFHDYESVYEIPGLYETIFYRTLRCNSPVRVVGLLGEVLTEHGVSAEDLVALDFGAGNGMVGEVLQNLGTRNIFGIDILTSARLAALRDRPWVYNDYWVCDMTRPPAEVAESLGAARPNLLTCVAALGFSDIPPKAFFHAYNSIADGGWIAFNIKEDFLQDADATGFSTLVNRMTARGILQMESYRRYCHRLSVAGEPLFYIAAVARKQRDIPPQLVGEPTS